MKVPKISPIPDGEVVSWRLKKDVIYEAFAKRKARKGSKRFEEILLEEMRNESGSGAVGVHKGCKETP